jgi:hypothetical protein
MDNNGSAPRTVVDVKKTVLKGHVRYIARLRRPIADESADGESRTRSKPKPEKAVAGRAK